jgi:hypothetical protein
VANFLTDDFTGGNGSSISGRTASGGGTWSVHTGTAAVIYNNAMRSAGAASYFFHSAVAQADGESVAGQFIWKTTQTIGVLSRCSPASGGSFYMAYWASGPLSIWRKKNGALAQIKTGITVTADALNHEIKIKTTGTGASVLIEVYFDGVLKDSFSDTDPLRITTLGAGGFVFADAGSDTLGYHLGSISGDDPSSTSATATTLSGPTSGISGEASTNFTVGANGNITGTVRVTPNDSSGGGSFSPTYVDISSGTPTGTFTYTPASTGNKTIGTTNDGSLTNPSTITYASSITSAIVISTPTAADTIIQRSGTTGTVSVTGTYSGSPAPSTIEARLVLDGSSTAVSGFDWSTKVASPSAGNYSFSFTGVPQGGWYNVQVRYSNQTSITATSGKVGVGVLLGIVGQSNGYYFFRNRSTATTPNALVRVRGNIGASWAAPSTTDMAGAIGLGNALAEALSVPVGLLDYSASSGAMSPNWIPVTTAANRTFTNGVVALGGKLEAVVWVQGEGDADASRTQAQYYGDLGTLFADWRTQFGQASLPVILPTLGFCTSGLYTDAESQEITKAQIQKCSDANIYRVDRKDLPLVDTVHHTAAGAETLGVRCARAVLYSSGAVSTYRGPRITAVSRTAPTALTVSLSHDVGTDFTPTTGITGFRVLDGATPVTVSAAVRQSSGAIGLTLDTAPAALPIIQYLYGNQPTVSGVVLANGSPSLPLEVNDGVTATDGPATSVTLSGPSSGNVNAASTNFTVGADGAITGTVTVTPSDGGVGGSFSPTSVAISSGTPTATFTYTPSTGGVRTISVTNNGSLANPSSISYTSVSASAVTLSGPTSGSVSVASTNFTVGANGPIIGTVVVTPSDGGVGGSFVPTSVSISSGSPTGTFVYTPSTTGVRTISVTNNGSLSNPSSITYTSNEVAATAVTMSGPSGGANGSASGAFTVGANGSITGTVVVTPTAVGGGTLSPTTVSINSASPTGTFTYTPASTGTKTISVTNNGGLTNPSNISFLSYTPDLTPVDGSRLNNGRRFLGRR